MCILFLFYSVGGPLRHNISAAENARGGVSALAAHGLVSARCVFFSGTEKGRDGGWASVPTPLALMPCVAVSLGQRKSAVALALPIFSAPEKGRDEGWASAPALLALRLGRG